MIKISRLWTSWTVWFCMFLEVFVDADVCTAELKRQNGVKLRECLLESVTGLGFIMCIKECQSRGECASVGYSRRGLECELYRGSVARGDSGCLVTADPLFTYVDMDDALSSMPPSCSTSGSCVPPRTKCVTLRSGQTVCTDPGLPRIPGNTVWISKNPCSGLFSEWNIVPKQQTTSTASTVSDPMQETTSTSAEIDTSTVSSTSRSSSCPTPFIESDNGKLCISIVRTAMSRDNAKSECQKTNNSSLVLIDSAETQRDVSALLTMNVDSSISDFWIDGSYQNSKWTSSSGEMLYTNWKSQRRPSDGENCILMRTDSWKWEATICSSRNSFLCQIQIV